jgi:hypothetical protein
MWIAAYNPAEEAKTGIWLNGQKEMIVNRENVMMKMPRLKIKRR